MPGRRSLAWRSPVRSVVTLVTSGGWLGPRVGRVAHPSRGVAVSLQRALRDPSRHAVVAWKVRPRGLLGCPGRDTRALPRAGFALAVGALIRERLTRDHCTGRRRPAQRRPG